MITTTITNIIMDADANIMTDTTVMKGIIR